jgi:hypothetical protein
MYHDGQKMQKCRVLGFRQADPELDVDDQGRPMASNALVIVKISDCEIVEDEFGRKSYRPDKAPQAFKLGMGGTYYGYHKVIKRARRCRAIEDSHGIHFVEKGEQYNHVRKFMIKDGYVYSTSYDRPRKEAA